MDGTKNSFLLLLVVTDPRPLRKLTQVQKNNFLGSSQFQKKLNHIQQFITLLIQFINTCSNNQPSLGRI